MLRVWECFVDVDVLGLSPKNLLYKKEKSVGDLWKDEKLCETNQGKFLKDSVF